MNAILCGVAAGKGIVVEHAHLITCGTAEVPQYDVSDDLIDTEAACFDAAIKATRRELEQLRSTIPKNAPIKLGAFISLRLTLSIDVTLSRGPVDILKERKINAEWVPKQQNDKLAAQFDNIEDNYLRERKQDMLQVVHHIHNSLVGQSNGLNLNDGLFEDTILITHDLSPASTVLFKEQKIIAFVTDTGDPASHTVVLSRSLNVPSVTDPHSVRKLIIENKTVIVDGINGILIIEPDEVILSGYRHLAHEHRNHRHELNRLKEAAVTTADGVNIRLLTNIKSAEDIEALHNFGIDGIGLFRSKFLYLSRDIMSSRDEQHEVYSAVVKETKGKGVTFHTVDLGVDENPRWSGRNTTSNDGLNPVLGLAGIRLHLAEPVMSRTQMRATPRVAVHGTARMMWPMITSVSEVHQRLTHLNTTQRQLAERGETFGAVNVGCVVEIPSAAMTVGGILKLTGFISIGTNGLIQHVLPADRGGDSVNHLYQPDRPAVLKTIQYIIRTTNRVKKSVSICSEMTGNTALTRILLGVEPRRFSMSPNNLLTMRNIVLHSGTERFRRETARLLRNDDPEKPERPLKALNGISMAVKTAQ